MMDWVCNKHLMEARIEALAPSLIGSQVVNSHDILHCVCGCGDKKLACRHTRKIQKQTEAKIIQKKMTSPKSVPNSQILCAPSLQIR